MTVTTLEDRIIGMLAPATGTDASILANSDQVITEALMRNRVVAMDTPVVWHHSIGTAGRLQFLNATFRGFQGCVRACDDTTAAQVGSRIITGLGVLVTGWTMDEDGWITYSDDQYASGTQYVTAWMYDVNAAAAEVCEWMIANRAQVFAFTVSAADTYAPGEIVERLRSMAADLRARSIPRRVRRVRTDTNPSHRHIPRSRAGNDL